MSSPIEIKTKNILILGNGFDLAHGLPTEYSKFLQFIKGIDSFRDIVEKKRRILAGKIEGDVSDEYLPYLKAVDKIDLDQIDRIFYIEKDIK